MADEDRRALQRELNAARKRDEERREAEILRVKREAAEERERREATEREFAEFKQKAEEAAKKEREGGEKRIMDHVTAMAERTVENTTRAVQDAVTPGRRPLRRSGSGMGDGDPYYSPIYSGNRRLSFGASQLAPVKSTVPGPGDSANVLDSASSVNAAVGGSQPGIVSSPQLHNDEDFVLFIKSLELDEKKYLSKDCEYALGINGPIDPHGEDLDWVDVCDRD